VSYSGGEAITERILREAGFEAQVATAIGAIKKPAAAVIANCVKQLFKREPEREWRPLSCALARNKIFVVRPPRERPMA
jgi:hypothetical protein